MLPEEKPWRVEVIGLSSAGLFYLERLRLSDDICLVAAVDGDPGRRIRAAGMGCPLAEQPGSAISDATFFIEDLCASAVSAALKCGQHVVIHRPWLLTPDELQSLNDEAIAAGRTATTTCQRRSSTDFSAAMTAIRTCRLGTLKSAHFLSYEQSIPVEGSFAGTVQEFGYHLLDQLLVMNGSSADSVFATRFGNGDKAPDTGFTAHIRFKNGSVAQIEVNTASRLGYRSGWMLEGSSGSYRNDRIYTVVPDGEIVDEPLLPAAVPCDQFVHDLVATWRGAMTTLPTLNHVADVIRVINAIEESQTIGKSCNL